MDGWLRNAKRILWICHVLRPRADDHHNDAVARDFLGARNREYSPSRCETQLSASMAQTTAADLPPTSILPSASRPLQIRLSTSTHDYNTPICSCGTSRSPHLLTSENVDVRSMPPARSTRSTRSTRASRSTKDVVEESAAPSGDEPKDALKEDAPADESEERALEQAVEKVEVENAEEAAAGKKGKGRSTRQSTKASAPVSRAKARASSKGKSAKGGQTGSVTGEQEDQEASALESEQQSATHAETDVGQSFEAGSPRVDVGEGAPQPVVDGPDAAADPIALVAESSPAVLAAASGDASPPRHPAASVEVEQDSVVSTGAARENVDRSHERKATSPSPALDEPPLPSGGAVTGDVEMGVQKVGSITAPSARSTARQARRAAGAKAASESSRPDARTESQAFEAAEDERMLDHPVADESAGQASSSTEDKERKVGVVESTQSRTREETKEADLAPREERRVRPRMDNELAKRGKRLFGMLNSTLGKAKAENEKLASGEGVSRGLLRRVAREISLGSASFSCTPS